MTRIFVCVMLLGVVAHASPVDDARQHYQAGTAAFNLGDFSKAVIEYKAAYTAKQDPTFLYNIAQAARLAGDVPTALFFYRSFLRNMPSAPNKQEVKDRISSLETQLQEQRRPPNEPASPNNLETRPAHPETTTPSKPEAPVVEKPAEPKPETTTVAPKESPRTEPVAGKADKTPVYKKWWLWTVVGVVVVGAAVGIGVGVAMSSGHAPNSDLGNTAFFSLHF